MKLDTAAMAPTPHETPLRGIAARLEAYAMVLVGALLATVIVAAAVSDGPDAARLGGDYPAFYAAGEIVLEGDARELYEAERQAAAQAPLFPEDGAFLYFAYPPYVAAAYAPLAAIAFQWSLVLHVLLMAGLLLAAVRLTGSWFPFVARHPWVSYAVAIFFYPMLRAIIGGQNTALTLVLVILAARLEADGRAELAGVAAAGLLYKPQFGIPMAMLLIVARRWRMMRGWLMGAVLLYAVGAVMHGPGWMTEWWDQAAAFADQNLDVNGALFISVPGLLSHLFEGPVVTSLAGVWTAAVVAAVAWFWFRFPDALLLRYAVAVAGLVATLPQPLYYEAGLLLLPAAILLQRTRSWWALGLLWALGVTQVAAETLGFSPLGLAGAAGGVFVGWQLVAARSREAGVA